VKEFYANLKDHGAADALKPAQASLASQEEYAYLYYCQNPFYLHRSIIPFVEPTNVRPSEVLTV